MADNRRRARGARTALLLALLAVAGGGGCLHLEQSLTLSADGGLRGELHYSAPLETLPALTAAQAAIDRWQGQRQRDRLEQMNSLFNEKLAADHFSRDGLSLDQYRQDDRDGRRHVVITFKAQEGRRALDSGRLGDFELLRTAAGDLTLRLRPQGDPAPTPLSDERRRELRALCAGLRLVLRVEGPSPVVATTGTKTGDRTVEWVFETDKDPAFLERPPAVEATFAGAGLDAWGR